MYFEFSASLPRKTKMLVPFVGACLILVQLFLVPAVKAVDELSARELGSHCELLTSDPEGVDAQYCIRYIQGFIDGAVATDARVMLNAEETLSRKETFSERAMRTRVASRADRDRAAKLAGFCLGDPLPLQDVVSVVVADLAALREEDKEQAASAMEVVYDSLQRHYSCEL